MRGGGARWAGKLRASASGGALSPAAHRCRSASYRLVFGEQLFSQPSQAVEVIETRLTPEGRRDLNL